MCYYNIQTNLLNYVSLDMLHEALINNKGKTYCSGHIQRSCTSSSAFQLTMSVCGTHVRGPRYYHPPPLPLVSVSLPQGLWEIGKGQGRCWLPPNSYALARASHGSDPSRYAMAAVITDGSSITIVEHPCKCARVGDTVLASNRGGGGWGGEGGRKPERGGIWVGEGEGGGKGVR